MNPRQREYFRQKLESWKDEILRESRETLENLQEESQNHPDMADRASSESDRALELRTRDRQRKLISKIDAALKRIEDGTYGFCEETGDPIGIARLDARPIATLSLEAQESHERREKVYRDELSSGLVESFRGPRKRAFLFGRNGPGNRGGVGMRKILNSPRTPAQKLQTTQAAFAYAQSDHPLAKPSLPVARLHPSGWLVAGGAA